VIAERVAALALRICTPRFSHESPHPSPLPAALTLALAAASTSSGGFSIAFGIVALCRFGLLRLLNERMRMLLPFSDFTHELW
jgi:hypothetical protein